MKDMMRKRSEKILAIVMSIVMIATVFAGLPAKGIKAAENSKVVSISLEVNIAQLLKKMEVFGCGDIMIIFR